MSSYELVARLVVAFVEAGGLTFTMVILICCLFTPFVPPPIRSRQG
jgi:hypothetical protein